MSDVVFVTENLGRLFLLRTDSYPHRVIEHYAQCLSQQRLVRNLILNIICKPICVNVLEIKFAISIRMFTQGKIVIKTVAQIADGDNSIKILDKLPQRHSLPFAFSILPKGFNHWVFQASLCQGHKDVLICVEATCDKI